jgi:hypothetical protein
MGDLITNEPRRRPLGWVAGIALLGLIIAGVVIFRPSPTPPRSQPPVPVAPVSSASPDTPSPLPPPPGFPKLVTKTGVRLYIGSYGPLQERDFQQLDVDSRKLIPVSGLPRFPEMLLQVLSTDGGAVITGPSCRSCDVTHGSTVYVVHNTTVVRHFSVTGQITMSADNRSIWTTDEPGFVRRVDLTGHQVGARYRLPSGSNPLADTIRGLLLSHGQDVVLWDPATGKRRTITGYLTSNANTIVAVDHGLWVTDLRTDKTRTVPGHITRNAAALSADGSLLALARDDAFGVQHFIVLDMRTGKTSDLGGFSNGNQADFRWAGNSHWLVTSVLQGTSQRLELVAIWQPGMARPAFVRDLPPNYYVLD